MNRIIAVIFVALALLTVGCKQGKVKKSLLPGVSGKAGEVLIVMEKNYWNGTPGNLLRNVMQHDVAGLPQSEPLLNTVNISNKAFSELFRIHRNIVLVTISSKVESAEVTIDKDKWAQPQTVIYINAPSRESFIDLWNKKGEKVTATILDSEQSRLMNNYKKYTELAVVDELKKSTGVFLQIPKGYVYDLDTSNFVWMSHETPQISQGIFVYYYDYKDTSDFAKVSLINKRNEMLQKFVSGPREGSYMTTELQFLPQYRTYKWKNKFTAELRGLWKVEGDYMGGPFVSISQYDETNNRVVTVEGYVYAPKYDKRNYLRQLEAILYTIDFSKLKN